MNMKNSDKILDLLVSVGKLTLDDISRAEHILETFSVPELYKPGPSGKAMTNAQRQAKWREANRELALQCQREAMKKIRGETLG